MERTAEEIMNGDGTLPPDHMFAKRPSSPSESMPNTPVIAPHRRIRCKMCRQELATREHMLDHGQLGPATPLPTLTPAGSRRASNANDQIPQASFMSRRPSTSLNVSISRRPSNAQPPPRGSSSQEGRPAILSALGGRSLLESLSMSALETEEDSDTGKAGTNGVTRGTPLRRSSLATMDTIGRDLSDALDAAIVAEHSKALPPADDAQDAKGSSDDSSRLAPEQPQASNPNTQYASPAALATQLYSNPNLAALRRERSLSMTSITGPSSKQVISPPILMNPNCSGYFVEPMRWMEPFLEKGELAGKIICPNARCGVKLGNYDWAGVRCSCKEWVTPGFCIHKSKVDEIVV